MKNQFFGITIVICIWFTIGLVKDVVSQSGTTDNTMVNHQLWLDFYPHFYISDKLEYYGDLGYRAILQENIWQRICARPSVGYKLNNDWEIHGGIGFFYIFNHNRVNNFEIRLWQGIQFNLPRWTNLRFKNLVRIEERISFLTNNGSSSLALRLRYKLSGRLNIFKHSSETFWFIPFYIEMFFPVGDEIKEFFRNRGRIGIGLGYNPSRTWRFAFIFNRQSSRTADDEDLNVSDYAYQIMIRKYFNLE
jgi:hypothetical protein